MRRRTRRSAPPCTRCVKCVCGRGGGGEGGGWGQMKEGHGLCRSRSPFCREGRGRSGATRAPHEGGGEGGRGSGVRGGVEGPPPPNTHMDPMQICWTVTPISTWDSGGFVVGTGVVIACLWARVVAESLGVDHWGLCNTTFCSEKRGQKNGHFGPTTAGTIEKRRFEGNKV